MRVVIAMLKHETNSFSPVVTDLARFESWGLQRGDAVVDAYADARMPVGAYLQLARRRGDVEIVTPLAAEAMPSGLVEEDAYETLVEWILEPIRAGCDAVFLDLHGAMTARHVADGEGELLRRIRAAAPRAPIAVTQDLHANLTAATVDHCSALIGYKTYPHVDLYDVARQVGEILWRAIDGEVTPVMSWGRLPLLAQTLCMGSDDEPMKSLQQATRDLERQPGILAATVFGGFPMVDVEHAGVSAVVVADGDRDAADAARDRLLDRLWDQRERFVYRHRPLAPTLQTARRVNVSPTVLLDHADNVGSGGTADVMTVIGAVLDAGLDDVAVAAVYDPEAAAAMHEAGLGAELTLDLGGKLAMPALGLDGAPLRVRGEVIHLADGRWTVRGPMYTGVRVDTGPTAVLRVGAMRLVVTSKHHEPWDSGIFSENGIDPSACRYLLLKSRIHYRAGFAPLAKATFTLDGDGVTTSDNQVLEYHNLRRPIYPLDADARR